uniref:Ribosomal protein S18 n=1 Tax=Haptolina ericina TaxID=156174 RepID=A0A7S3AT47_9EUKA|mmetsp:Transcript_30700/g.69252  ORF Transcript_30700/g.69252 Transcript_30700/m.69252 type:complete len:168 (+) Transcript_30700:669-1172(+)
MLHVPRSHAAHSHATLPAKLMCYRPPTLTHRPPTLTHRSPHTHTSSCAFGGRPLLNRFVAESGAILPRALTGTSHRKQRKLQKAIKRAQQMALMPIIWKDLKYKPTSYADQYSQPERKVQTREDDEFADPPDIRFPGRKESVGLQVSLDHFQRLSLQERSGKRSDDR